MRVTRAEWPLPEEQPWQEQGHWWDLRTQSSPCCCWFCCTPPPSSPPPPPRPSQPQVMVNLKHCTHFVRKSSWSRSSKRIVSSNHSTVFQDNQDLWLWRPGWWWRWLGRWSAAEPAAAWRGLCPEIPSESLLLPRLLPWQWSLSSGHQHLLHRCFCWVEINWW